MKSNTDSKAQDFAVDAVSREAFYKRKGHGGGPCTRRVLTPEQLRRLLHGAISNYRQAQRYFERNPEA